MLEVKTTDGSAAPPLRGDQAKLGGKLFADSRLDRAAVGKGMYATATGAQSNAMIAKRWLNDAKAGGKKISYEKYDMFIEDPKKGCIKKDAKSSPWEKKTTTPRRRK